MSIKLRNIYKIPDIEGFVESYLSFTICGFAWRLANDYDIYKRHEKSEKHITVFNLIQLIIQLI